MHGTRRSHRKALLALLAGAAVSCGDVTSSTGTYGMIDYSLYTRYEMAAGELTEVSIITGHTQEVTVELTETGEEEAADPSAITHSVTPSSGVTLNLLEAAEDEAPDIEITVTDPGTYTLQSTLEGEVFDEIELVFDTPVSLDLITRVRGPYETDFQEVSGTPEVEEGTQAVFLPIPLDSAGDRIAGDFEVEIIGDPADSVVPGYNIHGVYEDDIWYSTTPASVYLIEPGEVSVTLDDVQNGVSAEQSFTVTEIE